MPIKFSCPHCKRGLSVKEHLAGRRGACPACKKLVVIPAAAPAAPAVEDIEAAAAAALADEPKPAAPVQDNRTIDFTCPYCDTPVKIGIALAGKNAPCPECRRIIKVPVPAPQGPKDWRQADTRVPTGARREELEGAWGSTTSVGAVSQQALAEAEAIPEAPEPVNWGRRTVRLVGSAAVLCVVGGVVLLAMNLRTRSREDQAVTRALAAVATPAAGQAALAAEVHRGAGEFYARDGKAADAGKQLNEARGLALQMPESSDRDALLIDIAVTQVDLGGEDAEVKGGTRLKWADVQKALGNTLGAVRSPRARLEGVRLVSRKLIARGKWEIGLGVVRSACPGDDLYEGLAVLGLELVQGKDPQHAANQADAAQQPFDTAPSPKKEGDKAEASRKKKNPPPALIALWLALNKPDKAEKLGADDKVAEHVKTTPPEIAAGYVAGLAWQGRAEESLGVAQKMESSLARLQAVADLAAALAEGGKPDAARLIEESVALAEADGPTAVHDAANLRAGPARARREAISWLLLRLVRAGAQAGVSKETLQRLTGAGVNPDPGLRGRAQLEVLRGQLKASKGKAEVSLADEVDKEVLAHGLALEAIARYNATQGQKSVKVVDAWDDEARRPFGYIGLALGVQDR